MGVAADKQTKSRGATRALVTRYGRIYRIAAHPQAGGRSLSRVEMPDEKRTDEISKVLIGHGQRNCHSHFDFQSAGKFT